MLALISPTLPGFLVAKRFKLHSRCRMFDVRDRTNAGSMAKLLYCVRSVSVQQMQLSDIKMRLADFPDFVFTLGGSEETIRLDLAEEHCHNR